ncbi:MAG: glycosyltransferase family 2 protein, partial [Eudoraea sp.]|nr:glycosyltransferase family 2 protein [Eudoraea sp.]
MRYYIVIPAHNEEAFLGITLQSVMNQSHLPARVLVVNDNSTDGTAKVISGFAKMYPQITGINHSSEDIHIPGAKVVEAFQRGLKELDDDYEVLVKLDADLVLPTNYFERIASTLETNPQTGIIGGFAYERSRNGWDKNHPMKDDHVRGGFKAYTRACYKAIGGLRASIGWDTVDELLAKYHDFQVQTLPDLRIQHLRPTGKSYVPSAKKLQGRAMYVMRYGLLISLIASLKMAWKQKNIRVVIDNIKGYNEAARKQIPYLINESEGKFVRSLRWRGIR